jgi:hypothetical protein
MQSQQELSKLSTNNEIKDNFKFSNLTDYRIDIPNELKERNQWVTWKLEERNNGKTAKVPYQGNGKTKASTINPDHWSTWENINRSNNKGFVFTDNDPYTFIDLDDCIDADGKIAEWALKVIQRLNTYTEYSPSRKGFHLICKANKKGHSCRKSKIEIYDSKHYATMTGNVFESYNVINDRQDELDKLYVKLFKEHDNEKSLESTSSNMSDEKIIELASNAENAEKFKALYNGNVRGYKSNSEADLALCSILAFYTGNNPDQIERIFRGSGLYRSKWQRDDYRNQTITKAIENTSECYRSPDSENQKAGDDEAQAQNKTTHLEKFKYPKPIPLTEIMQKEFEPRKDVINDLVTFGLTWLFSAEKIGKSSIFRQVGYSVATGERCFGGTFSPAISGHVLYLSFEDDNQSIQESMELFCHNSAPPNYQFQYEWPRMGNGCIRALESYVKDFPNTKLIIIDTWAYIRSKDKGNISFGRYVEDVEDLNRLKKFINKHEISIMVSTHTGKAEHKDWTRNVHGGVGQTATADTIIYIERQRSQSQGYFHITGKRIREKSLVAKFQHRSWVLQEYSDFYNLTQTTQEYWDVLVENQNKPMTPKEVLSRLYPDLDEDERLRRYDAVRQQLMRMVKSKRLQKVDRSYYRIHPKEFEGYKKIKTFESQCCDEKV